MNKIEYGKCKELMQEAIQKAKQSHKEYKAYNQYLKEKNVINAETEQRKADQHYGEAVGMNQVLVMLGFKHDGMKELSEML